MTRQRRSRPATLEDLDQMLIADPPSRDLPDDLWCDLAQDLWTAIWDDKCENAIQIISAAHDQPRDWQADLVNLRSNGMTPLVWLVRHCADPYNNIAMWMALIHALLDAGASVNAKDMDHGMTALHYAASHPLLGVAKVLVEEYHADITIKDDRGFDPKDAAKFMKELMVGNDAGYDQIIDWLGRIESR